MRRPALIILPAAAAVAVVLWLLYRKKDRLRRWLIPGCLLALAVCAALILPTLRRVPGLTVTAVDVGQGQCLVIRSGTAAAVVDCGSSSVSDPDGRLLAFLRGAGVDRVDLLLLTHYHSDHCSGVPDLLRQIPVRTAVLPPPDDEVTWDESIRRLAEANGCQVFTVGEAPADILFGDASVRVWPPRGGEDGNERCLAMLFSQGPFDVLVTGDMPASGERELLEEGGLPDIELLVAGHHGSAGSSCEELLRAVTPEAAVISVGENDYGHPADSTLRRLERFGITVFRTDLLGTFTLTSDMEVN